MKNVGKKSNRYQWYAILAFIGSGVVSTCLFYQVTRLPVLQGASDQVLSVAIASAWVMVFPVWMILFFVAMALVDIIGHILDE